MQDPGKIWTDKAVKEEKADKDGQGFADGAPDSDEDDDDKDNTGESVIIKYGVKIVDAPDEPPVLKNAVNQNQRAPIKASQSKNVTMIFSP